MNRPLAFVAAILSAAISVSSACMAGPLPDSIGFELKPSLQSGNLQLALFERRNDHHNNVSGDSYTPKDLVGLDYRAFVQNGPVSFALVREAGRVDCSGTSRNSLATGQCRFTADPNFSDYLASRGIGRPSRDEAFALTMTGARRAMVETLNAHHYPRPNIDKFIALSAMEVTGDYIDALASRGFRPKDLDELTSFAALHITPEYIEGLKGAGFPGLDADGIVQFKALDITPQFVTTMAAAGYPKLTPDELAQFAALHITPEYIDGFRRAGFANLDVDTIVQLKALDVTPEFIQSLKAHGLYPRTTGQLVKLKIGLDE